MGGRLGMEPRYPKPWIPEYHLREGRQGGVKLKIAVPYRALSNTLACSRLVRGYNCGYGRRAKRHTQHGYCCSFSYALNQFRTSQHAYCQYVTWCSLVGGAVSLISPRAFHVTNFVTIRYGLQEPVQRISSTLVNSWIRVLILPIQVYLLDERIYHGEEILC